MADRVILFGVLNKEKALPRSDVNNIYHEGHAMVCPYIIIEMMCRVMPWRDQRGETEC
jgi:hypothetical protein